jgi:hypothetical protein
MYGRGIGSSFVHFLGIETRSSFVHFLHILEMFDLYPVINLYPVIGENTLASDGFLHFKDH